MTGYNINAVESNPSQSQIILNPHQDNELTVVVGFRPSALRMAKIHAWYRERSPHFILQFDIDRDGDPELILQLGPDVNGESGNTFHIIEKDPKTHALRKAQAIHLN